VTICPPTPAAPQCLDAVHDRRAGADEDDGLGILRTHARGDG